MSENKLKQIVVDVENYKRLQKLGHVPMSFNDIITELLDEKEGRDNNNTKMKKKAVEAAITQK